MPVLTATTPAISVVLPVFEEEAILDTLHRRLTSVLASTGLSYEVIFVNDGSRDGSWARILELGSADAHVCAVSLSRNFGHQIAITAGIELSRGDVVVVMDSDLQDPPELIPDLYAKYREGFDVVYAQRRTREGETWFKTATAKLFYRLIHRMAAIDIPVDTGDFRLMSRRVVEDLKRLQERHRFVRGLVTWVGYNQAAVQYDRASRSGGTTKYPLGNMIRFALDGFTGFSSQPLRLSTHVGAVFAFASLALMIGLTIYKLAGGQGIVTGWTSTVVAVLFLGGVQLLAIGILGEYIGRIYDEVKNRPLYLIRDTLNLAQRSAREATSWEVYEGGAVRPPRKHG
jgi:glycosyltransferase involved in cell wall biosynthesis